MMMAGGNTINWGSGNIDANPLFVRNPDDGGDGWGDDSATTGVDEGANDDHGDLRLQFGSLCIDAGDNTAVTEPNDLDDNPRIADGDLDGTATVDMGAYETPEPAFSLPGSGTLGDPYRISNPEELAGIGNYSGMWDKHFEMMNDIDMTGQTVSPIGSSSKPFTGTFDGGGFEISNLSMGVYGANNVGVFGYVGHGGFEIARLSNVRLKNVTLTASGADNVGGLAGYVEYTCIVENCSVTGIIIGRVWTQPESNNVGGLIGYNEGDVSQSFAEISVDGGMNIGGLFGKHSTGTVSNCYVLGSVYGEQNVGGFAGSAEMAMVENCYSASIVSGSSGVGGFIGLDMESQYTSCFWNADLTSWAYADSSDGSTGSVDLLGVTRDSTSDMQLKATYPGWDFTTPVWVLTDGVSMYPVFPRQNQTTYLGSGTQADPYQISDINMLKQMADWPAEWDKHFILTDDIDMIEETFNKAVIEGTFNGTFEGNGRKISDLFIDDAGSGEGLLGLFATIGSNAVVTDITIENCSITSLGDYVGALCGKNNGIITHCKVSGTVTGANYVGGLCGYNNARSALVAYSHSSCAVSGC